jgi:hypothetical protein
MERFEKKKLNKDDHKNIERLASILRIIFLPILLVYWIVMGIFYGGAFIIGVMHGAMKRMKEES